MPYLGDYAEDATLDTGFNTVSPTTGLPVTLGGSPVVSVYKANGTTESTAGVTLTVDHDSRTGRHQVNIDTSADAFYATGNDYEIVVTTGTVDGDSIAGFVVGTFSIENRTAFPKADYPTNFSTLGIESDGDLTKVNTLDGHTAQTGDSYARIGANGAGLTSIVLPSGGLANVTAWTVDITGNLSGSVGSVTGGINTAAGTITTLDGLDTAQDTQHGTTQTAIGNLNNLSAAQVNAEVDTALADIKLDHLIAVADSDDPADNSIIAKLAAKTGDWSDYDPNEHSLEQADLERAGITTGNSMIAAGLSDVQGATFDASTDSLEAIRNRGDAAWATGSSSNPTLLQSTTIATLASQTSFTLTAGSADDDAYNGRLIIFTDQATATQKAVGVISDYDGDTLTVTLDAAPNFTIATGDSVDILAQGDTRAASIDQILARTGQGVTVNTQRQADSNYNFADPIVRGTDYNSTAGNAWTWTLTGFPASPWQSGTTGTLEFKQGCQTSWTEVGTIALSHDGDETLTPSASFTDTDSSSLTADVSTCYRLTLTNGTNTWVITGSWSVTD